MQASAVDCTGLWRNVPDEALEELYKQLTQPGAAGHEQPAGVDEAMQISSAPSAQSVMTELHHRQPLQVQQAANEQPEPESKPDQSPLQFQTPQSAQSVNENHEVRQTLQRIQSLHASQEQQYEHLRQLQTTLLSHPSPDLARQAQEQHLHLAQQIELELKELHKLNKSVVFDHANLHHTRLLAVRLQLQEQRLELLRRELQHISTMAPPKLFASLAITEQPLPQVVFKSKTMEDAYSVLLITGAYADVQALSKVKASLVSEEQNWKSPPLENDTAPMDQSTRIAVFHNVKVSVSTRMTPIHLRFAATVQDAKSTQVAESNISYPMIVITNESQWFDAAGKLILADAFAGQSEISWPQFANAIHHHFLRATRQDPARPNRPLNESDWNYLRLKFFKNSATVNQQQATQFWSFFGPVACTLRFKRHINSLWFTGLIYGFITKDDCNRALQAQEVATFLIRFSESSPGLFALAYVSDDPNDPVKHYLVKHEDISSNKTLPDFLREKPQFQFCYQLDPSSGVIRKFPRDQLFAPYYSKSRKMTKESNGYVLL